jgi:hypothetical protein
MKNSQNIPEEAAKEAQVDSWWYGDYFSIDYISMVERQPDKVVRAIRCWHWLPPCYEFRCAVSATVGGGSGHGG